MPRGWLLDVHSSRRGDAVVLWLKNDPGGAVQRREIPFAPPFYVAGPSDRRRDLLRELSGREEIRDLREERIRLHPADPPDWRQEVLAVEVTTHVQRSRLAREIDALGKYRDFTLYDVDLSVPQLFYAASGLYPFAPVAWSGSEVVAREPPQTREYTLPELRVVRLEVRTDPTPDRWAPGEETPVRSVMLDGEEWRGATEAETFSLLFDEIQARDPDLLLTRGGDAFDLPHLYRRARLSGADEESFFLGREPADWGLRQRDRIFQSYGRIHHREPARLLAGRIHLDLEERFVEDVGLDGFIDMARLSGLGLATLVRQSPGTAFSAIEMRTALSEGLHIPWKKNTAEQEKSAAVLLAADRGGFILTPAVGLFEGVEEFDFASLFPNLMVKENLSLETLNCPCCPRSGRPVPGLPYWSCTVREGLVPRVLRPLLDRRAYYKRRRRETRGRERTRYESLVSAWKWVLVTSFGYQGYRNARFGRIECHEAINAHARELLVEVARQVRRAGWSVIHGIVDSLWLAPPPGADPEGLAREMSRRTGLPLSYEGRYRWIVFLPRRDLSPESGLGVAQRYYGLREDGEFKERGIEVRRHDVCPFVREVQTEVLSQLARCRNGREFRRAIPVLLRRGSQALRRLRERDVPPEELLLSRRLSRELSDYRVFSDTVAALRQLRAHGYERGPGEWVRYVITDAGSHDWRRRVRVAELLDGSTRGDPIAYAGLLARSYATLFAPFGYTEERLRALWGISPDREEGPPGGAIPRSLEEGIHPELETFGS
jgi:DNA polymerase elongation subunit (family B)